MQCEVTRFLLSSLCVDLSMVLVPFSLKTWYKCCWRELRLVTVKTFKAGHTWALTYPQELRETDKRLSLSKYAVCKCVCGWWAPLMGTRDGNKWIERVMRGISQQIRTDCFSNKTEHSLLSYSCTPREMKTWRLQGSAAEEAQSSLCSSGCA